MVTRRARASGAGAPPRVTVLLPVFNGASTLPRALLSIQQQTFPDWELLVVDDGSTDASVLQVSEASARDPRIRLVRRPRAGLVAALNQGVDQARGSLVARMDADDESAPERLSAQVEFLASHPQIGVSGCLVGFGGDRDRHRGYALHVDWLNTLVDPGPIRLNRFVESPLAHPSVMFRRELVERYGGYRAGSFPEDYELWLRWLDAGVEIAKVPRVLLQWNDPPGRLSRTDARYDREAFYRVKARYLARAIERTRGGRPLLVWGAGRPTRRRAEALVAQGLRIDGYVDIDPRKIGRHFRGRPVLGPEALPPPGEALVVAYVGTRGARDQIRSQLERRGYREGTDSWIAA